MLDVLRTNAAALDHVPAKFRYDREFVLDAVEQNAETLAFALRGLHIWTTVVLGSTLFSSGSTYGRLSDERKFVLEAVKRNGSALAFVNSSLIASRLDADKEVVREAVQQNGLALGHASANLRADGEVVREAVKQNGLALRYASADLRANGEVVREAVKQNALALLYFSAGLPVRGIVCEAFLRKNGYALQHASEKFRCSLLRLRADHRAFLLRAAVKRKRHQAAYASSDGRTPVSATVHDWNSLALKYIPANLRRAGRVGRKAIVKHGKGNVLANVSVARKLQAIARKNL